MPPDALDLESLSVTPEEVQSELEVVLRSPGFERSERLQRFLRYICDLTLKGESARINEYLIGSEVFRKGPAYNPNEDSIVRRQAHTLRQKLQEYYSIEGVDHAVRIELPVGRYVPLFRRLNQHVPPIDIPAADPIPTAPPVRSRRNAMLAVALAVAVFAVGWISGRAGVSPSASVAQVRPVSGVVQEIWGPWLRDNREVVICFSNPLTAVIKHFDTLLPPDTLPRRFKASPTDEAVFREKFRLPPGGFVYYTPVINQTKMGEAFAAVSLGSFFSRAGTPVSTTQSRFLSWEDLRKQNMILMGHDEANQWVDPLVKKYPFRLAPTSGKQQRSIINVTPEAGELAAYAIAYSDEENQADEEYALISMLPGIDGDHQLLLISGLNAQATQMATEYLTHEKSLTKLVDQLRKREPKHQGPWHFQAVLKAEVYDKVPTKASLVTLRVIR